MKQTELRLCAELTQDFFKGLYVVVQIEPWSAESRRVAGKQELILSLRLNNDRPN